MATREENLKKINDELEKMSDEELDQVAGGYINQTTSDSKILYDFGLMNESFNTVSVTFHWKSKSAEVDAGWSKAGITCCTKPFKSNQYFVGGKEISRSEAINILKENFPRIHNFSNE